MNFSAILDKNYISRLNALLFSLEKNCKDFNFFVVALDNEIYDYFRGVKHCIPISIQDIHAFYPELDKIERERDRVSYIFTLSPFYPSFILEKYQELDHICSLDVDQYFYSSPQPIFDLLADFSVLITPHRFSRKLVDLNFERFGKFNVSFQVFKRGAIGVACLNLWREQCLNWCFDREENGWYADQKYLDTWQKEFGNQIHEIMHKGLGLAPWNIEDVVIRKRKNKIFVDNELLILYHYQGLKILSEGYIYSFIDNYTKKNTSIINHLIYKPIIKCILRFTSEVDTFSRNNRNFDYDFMVDKADFVFKKKFGFLFEFRQYLKLQNWVYGIRNRFTNIFRR
jgi:hypothetical protein